MQLLQRALVQARQKQKIPDVVLLLEHEPVVTVGKAGGLENMLLSSRELEDKGISLYNSERGGNITYHGPGQLVVYPIMDLKTYQIDLTWYVRQLEMTIINTLGEYGITSSTAAKRTGVWLGNKKIAAIGIGIKKWVTYHGIALNINNDLKPFSYIVPCGLADFGVTSISDQLGIEVSLIEVRKKFIRNFIQTFQVEACELTPDKLLELCSSEMAELEQELLL